MTRTPGDERADAAWAELQRQMGASSASSPPPDWDNPKSEDHQLDRDAVPLWLWGLAGFAVLILCGLAFLVLWPAAFAYLILGGGR